MNDKEYRNLAFFIFPMLENLLHNLSTTLQELDNKTYDSRIVKEEVKKGKKTITKYSTTPLSQEQIYDHIEAKGYIPTLVATLSLIERLIPNAWTLEQISDFIHSQPEELQENIWMLYKFENCDYDNQDSCSIATKLESCKYAIQHCYSFMSGDGIMDKINSMFGYVAVQIRKNIKYILMENNDEY